MKYLRANDGPFITRELRKAIMKRSWLKTVLIKCEQMKTGQLTRSRGISVLKFFVKIRKFIILNLIQRLSVTTRSFWKTVKSLFSNKIQSKSSITLIENDVLESHEGKVAEIMNNFFVNITDTLGISYTIMKTLWTIFMRIRAQGLKSIFNRTLVFSKYKNLSIVPKRFHSGRPQWKRC